MKLGRNLLVTAAVLSTFAVSGLAEAQRGHGGNSRGYVGGHSGGHSGGHYRGHGFSRAGAFIGGAIIAGALLSPWYYGGPYYSGSPYYSSYPTVVEVVPTAPTVYYEQPRVAPAAPSDAGSWWYYCNESRAYYPYVNECASPWQRVAPQPPAAR